MNRMIDGRLQVKKASSGQGPMSFHVRPIENEYSSVPQIRNINLRNTRP